ncbi:gephyrin-like molybdotransferase receptor GlpR [Streptomyces sp. NPDC005708]|uniref:divisome protein SepX/GlpR n=1 Tax=Streptomyces sp. NPDC005708 TaxID=3154564 RepID=UPI0033E5D1D7
MSSSGLIYAVIVGAWAAYLVPMWLRRQDELNESRPTERFSTAIRLLSGRAGMERRYAKDLRARSSEEGERSSGPDVVTDSVDVRAFAMPPTGAQARARVEPEEQARREQTDPGAAKPGTPSPSPPASPSPSKAAGAQSKGAPASGAKAARPAAGKGAPGARKVSSAEAMARARRSKVLARRRRTTVMLFLAFTLGAIVAAVGGLAFLWAPGVPAVLLSVYIAHLRAKERKRFTYTMDRQRAEAAAQRLRERQPRRRPPVDSGADKPEEGPESESDPGLSALAADRRALVEQTDHAEWVDQQRERQRRPGHGDSWDPVPVPLPTYVTAPVAPRATPSVDLGAPDAWSSARSSAAEAAAPVPDASAAGAEPDSGESGAQAEDQTEAADGGRTDARRAASARRARERGRTPLFDQYEDGERRKAANE